MPRGEAERLQAVGALAAVQPDGTVEPPPEASPRMAADYLNGTDLAVLRRIRLHRPDRRILRRVLEMAATSGRSQVLIEALRIAAGE